MRLVYKFRKFLLVIVMYAVLASFLFLTNPAKLPVAMLIVPILLLFTALFLTVRLILVRFFGRLSRRRSNLYALYLSATPAFLLLLSSVDQLTWRDAFLVLFFVLCLWFYTSRLHLANNPSKTTGI